MVLNDGHFFDTLGPPHQDRAGGGRMTPPPMRILDTGLRPARWNVAMTAALARAARGRRDRRYVALPSLSGVRAARPQPGHASTPPTSPTAGAWHRDRAPRDRRRRRIHEPAHAGVGRGGRPQAVGGDLEAATRRHLRRRGGRAVAASAQRPASARPTTSRSAGARCRARAAMSSGRSAVLQGTVLIEDDMPRWRARCASRKRRCESVSRALRPRSGRRRRCRRCSSPSRWADASPGADACDWISRALNELAQREIAAAGGHRHRRVCDRALARSARIAA